MAADIYAQAVRAYENPGNIERRHEPMKAATAIGRGWLTVLTAGFVDVPSAANAASKCNGISMDNVDNSAGGAGDVFAGTESGVIDCLNSGANPCTAADRGKDVYAEDHQTIGNNAAAGSKIGTLEAFNPDGGMPGRPCRVRVILSR